MIGTKLYEKKARVYFFLIMYGILAIAGGVFAAQSLARNQSPSGAIGFMVIFGAGMFVMTLVRSRRPQVSVYEDDLEVNQSRTLQIVRYRNIVSVSQPDKNRLVVKLWEDGERKDVTIWLRELDRADVERLADFLSQKSRKAKEQTGNELS